MESVNMQADDVNSSSSTCNYQHPPFRRILAKILIFMMIIQGMPLWELSQVYSWQFQPQKLEKVLDLLSILGPATAEAAEPRVVCVPQLPTDLLVPHETWSGEPTTLKGVLRDPDPDINYIYYWTFGDGVMSIPEAVVDPDNLAAVHTYLAAPDTLFIARLNLLEASQSSSDTLYDSFDVDTIPEYDIFDIGNVSAPSNWSISGGRLHQTSNIRSTQGRDGTLLIKKDFEAQDIRLGMEISCTDNDTTGLVAGFQDSGNYYVAWVNDQHDSAGIGKYVDGVYVPLASRPDDDFPFSYSGSHTLGFSAVGDTLTLTMDNEEVLSVTDSEFSNGRVGIVCSSMSGFSADFFLAVPSSSQVSLDDEYRVLVKEKTLDVEVNKAIDDGLWWLYTNREAVDVYSTIPASVLVAPDGSPGLQGEYFNNTDFSGTPVLTRTDPLVDFDWGGESPEDGVVNVNYFSVRWTGELNIITPGEYHFATASDDGVRLYIDGVLVIDDWTVHGRTWRYAAPVDFAVGRHQVVFEYFENTSGANVGLYWKSPEEDFCRWNNIRHGDYYGNTTASAVQAFEINGHLETGDAGEDPYVDVVRNGINYMTASLTYYSITTQTYGDPDANGNGIGLNWPGNRPIYELGAVMDSLVASGTPDAIARTGGANVIGRRYQDIVQDMVDMYAWGQYDRTAGGGWRYNWNDGPDNSASQWGAIGMIAAERYFGCTVPQWVKDRNDVWLDYSYNGTGFGYTSGGHESWATTPSGMVQLSFSDNDITDHRWQTAESYLADSWTNGSNWFIDLGRSNRYYSYYAFAKAMRLARPQEVTHLSSGLDWYGDETLGLARILVDRQNNDGSWVYDGWPYVGEQTAAAWNIIILTRTLFEKPPVAVIHAEPNPGAVGQSIQFDGADSYHVDPAKEIVTYLWDFDASDGVDFDHPDATGITATWAFGDLRDYTVTLKVIDNSSPERFDTTQYLLHITVPPHPPTAVMGGPYIGAVGEAVQVDGSGSYDIDAGDGDSIISWEWESDFAAPYDFDEAYGETATLPPFAESGRHDIALRVTDDTATVFPGAGQPNLTDVVFGEIMIYDIGINDLAARPKGTKCQLTWSHIGVDAYDILRSEDGPNSGFERIGTTSSTYSTFIDYNVELNADYWYRIMCQLDEETVLSAPVYVYSRGRIRNQPPRILSNPPLSIQEDVLYQYEVDAIDPEGLSLTYILDMAPIGMDIDPGSGLITWVPDVGQAGTHDVMVRVQDARRAAATQFFTIMVTPAPNAPPTAVMNGPYETLVNQAVSFDATGCNDPDGAGIADYHWVFGDGSDGHGLQVTHAYGAPGTYVVSLYVIDNGGATGHAESSCQVGLPNRPPTANAGGPYVGQINTPIYFNGSQSYDPDADLLAYTWNFGDSTPAQTGVQVDHTYGALGTYQASLAVDDGRGGLDTMSFEVTVTLENQIPTAAISFSGLEITGEIMTFDGRASLDPDGSLAAYEWDFGDGGQTTGSLVTHVFQNQGAYTVTLTVTDNQGATNADNEVLNVAANQAPTAIIGLSGNLVEGQPLTFSAAGSTDPEGEELDYAWDFGDGTTAQGVETSHAYGVSGEYTVTLTVTDHTGLATLETRSLSIASSQGPLAVFSVSGSMAAGELISFDGSGSYDQSGGTIVSYAWDFGDGTSASGIATSHVYAQTGQYPVQLTVTDNDGLTSTGEVSLTVGSNQPPEALFGYSGIMVAGGDISFTAAAAYDPEGHALTAYQWDFGDGSSADTVDPNHAFATEGDHTITLTVTDNTGQTDSASKTLHVVSTAAPQADFTLTGEYVIGQTLVFDGSPSTAPTGHNLVSYAWDFGDGSSATGVQADHVYDQPGRFETILKVTDDQGGWCEAHRSITIYASMNHPPTVQMTAPNQGIVDEAVAFSASGFDPDGDPLIYEWDFGDGQQGSGPSATHTYTAEGNYTVSVAVDDGRGSTATATATVELIQRPDHNVAPVAEAGGPYSGNINTPVSFDGSLSYDLNGDLLTYTWDFGDGENGSGTTPSHTYAAAGTYTIVLTVTDPDGLSDTDTAEIQIIDPADTTPPTVLIETPAMDATVTEPVDVVGSVEDTDLQSWLLEYAEAGTSNFIQFASGSSEITSDILGLFDPTMLMNGFYELRLSATDFNGHISRYSITVQVTGELKVGLFTVSFKDLSIPLVGIPIDVIRTYDSRERMKSGDFGYGWSLSVKSYPRITKSTQEGYGWPLQSMGGIGGLYTYCLQPTKMHAVTVEFPDGRTFTFDFAPNPGCQAVVPLEATHAAYTARPGTNATLEPVGDRDLLVIEGRLYTYDMQLYDPREYKLTLEDGRVFWIDHHEGLQKVEDPNGNRLTFTHDGILHSSGESITFNRDAEDRITRVTDPAGNFIAYTYDANGDLISMTDRLNNSTDFTYEGDHYLSEIHDPLGNRVTRNEYDAGGRLVATIDAEGNRVEFTHDISARQEVIRDRRGNVTVHEYDVRGNVTAKIDALGNRWEYTYDEFGNKLSESDPLGNSKSYIYDADSHLVQETDPLGNVIQTISYDAMGHQTQLTDALGNSVMGEYDSRGNLVRDVDQAGGQVTYTYDSAGLLLSKVNGLGYAMTYEYDSRGNRTRVTDALGHSTTFTYDFQGRKLSKTTTRTTNSGPVTMTWQWLYDANGRVVEKRFPDGSSAQTQYNELGKKTAVIGRDGHTTTYDYDVRGNLGLITHPDGTVDEYQYDAEGNKTWESCHGCGSGIGTAYEYDILSRKVRTIYPDGSETRTIYDAAGRPVEKISENGFSTFFVYDAAGREVKITDALGNETINKYDAAGRKTAVTDSLGRVTMIEYNAANIPIRTIFPDGTSKEVAYDLLGRKISETDQAGLITRYEYDAMGRLLKVTDPMGNESRNVYDEMGQRLEQIDANGHVTRWTYDDAGHVRSRTLPLGMVEYFTYNSAGQLMEHQDFNGHTTAFDYDAAGRLATKYLHSGDTVSYAYTDSGKTAAVTDAAGTTTFAYDSRDRLIEEVQPDGTTISYTYDAVGNRLSVSSPNGTTGYVYDALNRLVSVAVLDGSGRETRYEYDAVGNRIRMLQANGMVTRYRYDNLNRLTFMENTASDGTVLSSYTYTLGLAGNRLGVAELGGRTVAYQYDGLYRLLAEDIIDPVNGNELISYTYDAFGNRLTKTAAGTTLYTYDDNDRLISEEGPAGIVTSYNYDNNGNRLQKSSPASLETYEYDGENHLLRLVKGTDEITYDYDFQGLRVSQEVNGQVTRYLFDRNVKHAQVLEEHSDSGFLIARYIWGNTLDPVLMSRSGVYSFYLADGNMNVRQLADEMAQITDTWNLDAFGNILQRTGSTENPYLLHGQHYDSNCGFYYLRARWLDPGIGAFISQDPVVGSIFEPQDLHKYVFARNNPLQYYDPSGLKSLLEVVISVAIMNVLITGLKIGIEWAVTGRIDLKKAAYRLIVSACIGIIMGLIIAGGLAILSFVSSCTVLTAGGYVTATVTGADYMILKTFIGALVGYFEWAKCVLDSFISSGSPLLSWSGASIIGSCILQALITTAVFIITAAYSGRETLDDIASLSYFAISKTGIQKELTSITEIISTATTEYGQDLVSGGNYATMIRDLINDAMTAIGTVYTEVEVTLSDISEWALAKR